jgi:hypothetical protein
VAVEGDGAGHERKAAGEGRDRPRRVRGVEVRVVAIGIDRLVLIAAADAN